MKPNVIRLDRELITVMEVIEQRTIAFMREHLAMLTEGTDRRLYYEEGVTLRSMTAIVGVGSETGLYVAYSYDDSLIRAMTSRYTAELSIAPEDEELYAQETASDITSVIIGNSTADLAKRGEVIPLSPPILMVGARKIHGRRETTIAIITLRFQEGALDVAFVGPRRLFDDHLNYQGDVP